MFKTKFLSVFAAIVVVAMLASCGGAEKQESKLAQFDFLVGEWFIEDWQMYETWEKKDGQFVGRVFTIKAGDTSVVGDEYIKEVDGEVIFVADMEHNPAPVDYKMTKAEGKHFTFENPEHDFPSKIEYWLDDGGQIHARIQGVSKMEKDGETVEEPMKMEFDYIAASEATSPDDKLAEMLPKEAKLGKAAQITIGVNDVNVSKEFYATLGFKEVISANDPYPFVQMTDGSMNLNLSQDGNEYLGFTYFDTNMDERIAAMSEEGIESVPEMAAVSEMLAALYADPDGKTGIALVNFDASMFPVYPVKSKGCCGEFGELAIPVSDFDVAAEFWQKCGYKQLSVNEMPYKWGIFSDGLMIVGHHETDCLDKPSITYFSADAKEIIAGLQETGLEFKNAMPGTDGADIVHGTTVSPDGWPVNIFGW